MVRQTSILLAGSFLLMNSIMAQDIGILPLSGIRYFKEGIWAKSIEVKIDGDRLLNNRLPLNKEIEISLVQPTGFTPDKKTRAVFAGAEYTLVSAKGDVIIKNPNLFLLNEAKGFTAKDFKTLSLKFGINEALVKYNSTCTIKIRVYDLKGKNQLRLEFPVNTIRYGETVRLSKSINVKPVKSPANANCIIAGLNARNMVFAVDTTMKENPKMAYASLVVFKIVGSSLGDMFQGKESFWVYDLNLNEIKITDILLKEVAGAMENSNIDYTLKIPFRLKTAPPKGYIVRFRWESADKTQVIEVVVTI